MGTVKELPEAKLRYLTDIDHEHHLALLATNHKMLKFARQLGFRQQPLPGEPGTVHVLRAL